MQSKTSVHILADPIASTWLGLNSPDEGAVGITIKLDAFTPIDAQIATFVAETTTAAAQKQNRKQQHADQNKSLPPPSTLGLMLFRNDAATTQFMKRNQLAAPIPKYRSLGLDSLLLLADTLLPGVDSTAATSSSTSDLIAFVNASGGEASPFQLIHSGVTLTELGTVAGLADSNGSFGSNPVSSNNNTLNGNHDDIARAAATTSGATPRSLNASFANNSSSSGIPAIPGIPSGRLVLLLVGDLLSYCSKDIVQMIAQMARPFRSKAPEVIDHELLAYCAQDACLVGSKVLVARDGCAVWRPQEANTAQGRRRAASLLHSSANAAAENYLPEPVWNGGAAVFVNHPIGIISVPSLPSSSSSTSSVFRRVLRITWNDAFLGAEHGGPEGRRRFSAPTVAVGIIHSSQVHQATKATESGVITGGHVFGNVRESVMWCMSPDAALFAGPHLQPVRGPSLQPTPSLYLPPTKQTNAIIVDNNDVNNNNAQNQQQQQSVNPTVLTTTVTLICDANMGCLTILNNSRRVASWDISDLWAKNKNADRSESEQSESGENNNSNDQNGGNSIFYPIVDLGFPGTIVEIIS